MADRRCMAIMENDQILLVRQTYRGQPVWTLPGGGLEPGETPAEAAVRETKEEVNLDVKVLRLLYQGPPLSSEGTYYCHLGQIISGHARVGHDPGLPEEALSIRPFPANCPVSEHSHSTRRNRLAYTIS
jgi:8-oxo-dGTP diphosphatase